MKTTKRPLNLMLNAALRLVQGRDVQAATRAVQHALRGAVRASTVAAKRSEDVIDVIMRERKSPATARSPAPSKPRAPSPAGSFVADRQRAEGLGRDYKLFVPPNLGAAPRPLIVMLHGCTQNPDDFAAGTAMNDIAVEHDFLVLYPEQSQGANTSRCWNWFKHNHQARGAGEPAVIAGMVETVMSQHAVDPRRIYVAGLSAGGAMAAILGDAYPDIFAAVGVHSGLPTGAANDATSAFGAMKSGVTGDGSFASILNPSRVTPPAARDHRAPPTIVFHGDADKTVNPVNGDQVVAASLGDVADVAKPAAVDRARANGRDFTRKVFRDADGSVRAEHWTVHGAGHAWSGGRSTGSYADPKGPDASREMTRFFLEHPLRAKA